MLNEQNKKLLRKPLVSEITGLAYSTIYYLIKKGTFPKPVKLGLRSVAWREKDIFEWIDSREPSL